MSKRFISILLCLTFVLTMLVACNEKPEASSSSTTCGIKVTTQTVPLPTNDGKTVALTDYRVIYGSKMDRNILDYIKEQDSSLELKLSPLPDVAVAATEAAAEIVVGDTNRKLGEDYKKELKDGEYLIRYDLDSRRIYILGSDDRATFKAVRFFFESLLDKDGASITFTDSTTTYIKRNELILASYKINGIDIDDYKIIYPQNADRLTAAAAENIADYFKVAMGVTVSLSTDSAAESTNEILVGDTNRDEDDISFNMTANQYAMFSKDGKLVFRGNSYMIGGGFGMLVKESIDVSKTLQQIEVTVPTEAKAREYVYADTYTNAILMIGDGMGFNHINMALDNGTISSFAAQSLPYHGSAVTRSQSVLDGKASFTDSAAAGTALAAGYKTYNGYVGKDPLGKTVKNLRELAYEYGAQTAVVTTDALTGATPAAFLAHSTNRNDSAIGTQIDSLKAQSKVDYASGTNDGTTAGILKQDTRAALMRISDTSDPFFLMVEEAYIDKHSHSTSSTAMRNCVDRFDEAIAYAIEFTLCHPGTALIITADHETGGITKASNVNDLLAAGVSGDIISEYGSNMEYHMGKYGYCFTSYVSGGGTEHTNADVPVYAIGPDTEIFNGVRTENIDISRFIAKAYGATSFGQTAAVE